MASLAECLRRFANELSAEDKAEIRAAMAEHKQAGVSPKVSNMTAIESLLDDLDMEIVDVLDAVGEFPDDIRVSSTCGSSSLAPVDVWLKISSFLVFVAELNAEVRHFIPATTVEAVDFHVRGTREVNQTRRCCTSDDG